MLNEMTETEVVTQSLGRTIRERRRQLGVSQRDVAELAGVSVRFLGEVERGKPTVRLSGLIEVCRVLGLAITLS
jgi:HTH-type transcriptional regulator/antitoxin HipB